MLNAAARLEMVRAQTWQQRVVLLPPAEARQVEQQAAFLDFIRPLCPPQPAARVGAV